MTRFTEVEDIMFLKEVAANPPFQAEYGTVQEIWESITEKVSKATGRDLKYRSLKDHFDVLMAKFKRDETASKAASGISEEVTEKDTLLMECHDLMRLPKPTKVKPALEKSNVKELALKRWRDMSELGETNGSELSATEARPYSSKRRKSAELVDLLGEQVAVTRISSEEKAALKKVELELNRIKIEYDMEKYREDLELRKVQQEADIELRRKLQEAELRRQEVELEYRKSQQEGQRQQNEAMVTLLNLLAPLISKINP